MSSIVSRILLSRSVLHNIKLPTITIRDFDGNILYWNEIWTNFSEAVDKQPISKTQKVTYLKSLKGKAYESVIGFALTEANYDVVAHFSNLNFSLH